MPAKKPAAKPTPVALPNRRAVAATLAKLGADPETDARAQLALTLADQLDDGAGMATAAIARELRATLQDLESAGGGEDELDKFLASLSTPVVDAKD
jgi:hypothetical protein